MLTKIIYLSLGSNIGDRQTNLRAAIAALAGIGVRVRRVSEIYETEPVDYLDQDWFLNCVAQGETQLEATQVLRGLRQIETQMASKKKFAKGPRLIDLDILLYGDDTIDTAELQVPHPRMLDRQFVLVPLAEITPQLRHPSWSGDAAEMLMRTADKSIVRRFSENR
jgi:2-amino-4-hydroxy-6-hydroxymethyldihydropteridine diphosphokinase